MDFLDPNKKKKHNQRLFVGYFLIGVAIVLAASILFLQSYGYDVDHKTGKVIQNGLIFVSAQPESATVYLNGHEKGKTDVRLTVPAAAYTVELKRDGYRSWKRSFNLEGSSIERLQYPVLFPTKLTQKDVATYSETPSFATQSPDRRWILLLKPGALNAFDVFDANNPKTASTILTLPNDLLTPSTDVQKLSLVEWSTDNRHVLIKHAYADKTELIMVDRDTPANSINLTKTFALEATTTVSLRDKRFDQLYLLDTKAQTLTTLDTKSKQTTMVLSGVLAFKSYGSDTLLYAATDPASPTTTVIKMREDGKDTTIRTFKIATDFLLDLTRFDDHWFAVVGPKSDGRVSIYRDPTVKSKDDPSALPVALSVLNMKDPQQVVFSANARFVMSQSGSKFAVYDAETNRRFYYDIDLTVNADQKATWMDGHRIVLNSAGKVEVFDFDGSNKQSLVPIAPESLPFFDRDYTRLYALAPSVQTSGKAAITQTPLKLNLQ